MSSTFDWPSYKDFHSSLPSKEHDFSSEIDEILNLPMIYGYYCFGELMDALNVELEMSDGEYRSDFIPELSDQNLTDLKKQLFLSPKLYFEQKSIFERRIENGQFRSFLDHLKFYNAMDVKIFYRIIENLNPD